LVISLVSSAFERSTAIAYENVIFILLSTCAELRIVAFHDVAEHRNPQTSLLVSENVIEKGWVLRNIE